ncbi:MAG: MFS transporter [Bacteroidetes bacterium]|nr:MFS transporter [Bacteroidota bacterium]
MQGPPEKAAHVGVWEKVAYGLGDTATNLVWRTLMVFLPIFYTDVFGLTAASVGTLLLVCRYWDGITDFIMGLIADRTNTRWGKFRPWILWSTIPFGIMTVLTFTAVDVDGPWKLVYAYVTYSGLILAFTANNVPYSALTGVLSPDPAERTSISSYRFFFAFLGGLLTQGLNIPLVAYFGQGDDVAGYTWTMTLFAAVSVVLLFITFASTRERVKPVRSDQVSLRADIRLLFRNRPWLILFGIGLLFVTMTSLKQGVTMYYFKYFVGDVGLAAGFMVSGLLAAMVGAGITSRLTLRFGRAMVMRASFALALLTSALLYFVGASDVVMLFVLSGLTEFATGPIVALFFAMLGDAADFAEWKFGSRMTGLVYSAGTLSMKFGTGIAGALTGWLLTAFGYVANVGQTAEALDGIRILISILPAGAAAVALIVFAFYPLNDALLHAISRDLDLKREARS